MTENDNNNTLFTDEFDFSLSDENATIHSTINPRIRSNLTPFLHEMEKPLLDSGLMNFDSIVLGDPIGEGGMGIVYSAQEFFPHREVAIKRLKSEEPKLVSGLLDEAMVMGRLSHPNIPPVYQLRMNEKKQPEVIMKKIEGDTFQKILGSIPQRKEELRSSLHVLIQVCHAVEFAHSLGILHRDLKPENIMVGAFNQVYLMDWGLAVDMNNPQKARRGLAGTPAYMAPEMLKGDPKILIMATDVYLLGTILHEILVGEFRHKGNSVRESLASVKQSNSYDFGDDVPRELAELCNQSCAKESSERPQTVLEFRERLESFFEHWEVYKFVEQGYKDFRQYKRIWKEEKRNIDINYPLLLQISQNAKSSFEQALKILPDSTDAKEGLISLIEVMINQALYANEFHRAVVLFEDCPFENPKLAERLKKAEEDWQQEQERQFKLDKIEKELDPNLTLAPRFLLQRILIISIIFTVWFLILWQRLGGFKINSEQLFYSTLAAVVPVWVSVAVLYKRLMVNSFGRQAVRTVFYTSVSIAASRYSAWILDIDMSYVAILDCIILALGLINSAPAIKNGVGFGILSFVVSAFAMAFPEYSLKLFNITVVSIVVLISLEWRIMKFLSLGDEEAFEDFGK